MLEIQAKLKLSALLEPFTFKSLTIAKSIEQFFVLSDNASFSFLRKPFDEQKQYLQITLKRLLKPLTQTIDKIWVQVLFIDTLLSTCQTSLLSKELIQYLIEMCDEFNHALNKAKTQKPSKNHFFGTKITTGLSKIKSMINISTSLNQTAQTPSFKNLSSPRANNMNQILSSFLDSFLAYERKKLQSFDFVQILKLKLQNKQPVIEEKDNFQNLVQNVWKIVNLMSFHSTIIKSYRKIAHTVAEIHPLVLATFVRFCKDSLILYSYIVDSIEIGAKIIKEKYDAIMVQKFPKQIKKTKLEQLGKDKTFIEVDNMIQELTQINETVFYLFCSKTHFQYLNLEIPKNFFLNTTNQRLDEIYKIIKEVQNASQKQQRAKIYITQLMGKMDESVSKVIEKEKSKQSMTNVTKPAYFTGQIIPENEEEGNEKEQKTGSSPKDQMKKKIGAVFDERTEDI